MSFVVGYQPTLRTKMGFLQERITSTKEGPITSIQAVYVLTDDFIDLAPATTFVHLDATTVLSRELATKVRSYTIRMGYSSCASYKSFRGDPVRELCKPRAKEFLGIKVHKMEMIVQNKNKGQEGGKSEHENAKLFLVLSFEKPNDKRNHVRICWNAKKVFYECASLDHFVPDCPSRTRGQHNRATQTFSMSRSDMRIRTIGRLNSALGTSSRNYAKTRLIVSTSVCDLRNQDDGVPDGKNFVVEIPFRVGKF
ncbi:hypothetical protein Goshw_029185 [Gossypium schwendimanii]|uniref:H(+)-transporting two-sector ATPase n=1 Tax=Gossypium schwendimanii TaxID=34291 RepID=A0A7J9KNU5_GOSSC|nr:hypothetical protein [Gossypium schwendimanii]